MKKLKPLFLFFAFSLLSSCYISFGTTSEYRYIKSNNPTLLKHLKGTDLVCNAQYSDSCKVIVTDAITLKKCLFQNDKAVVFIWKPGCMRNAENYSLDSLQRFFSEKGIALYVVARNYTGLMNKKYHLDYPIIGIDTKYYKSNLVKKYLGKFVFDLAKIKYEDDGRPIMYLENGNYLGWYRLTDEMKMDSTGFIK